MDQTNEEILERIEKTNLKYGLIDGESEKAESPKAKKGEYVVAIENLKCDGKKYKRGEVYSGKLYPNLLSGKKPKLIKSSEWENR